jgi:hypothetical protein
MLRLIIFSAMTAFTIMATLSCSGNTSTKDVSEYQYEVLSPWAEVDPVPLRGISPRLDSCPVKRSGFSPTSKGRPGPSRPRLKGG